MVEVSNKQEHLVDDSIVAIQSLDLEYLVRRVMKEYEWDSDSAKDAVRKYKKFLILHLLHPSLKIVPTHAIDLVWHQHILHTEKYMENCQKIFGCYFHHHPNESNGAEEKEEGERNYIMTARLYERNFQESYGKTFDLRIWLGS